MERYSVCLAAGATPIGLLVSRSLITGVDVAEVIHYQNSCRLTHFQAKQISASSVRGNFFFLFQNEI